MDDKTAALVEQNLALVEQVVLRVSRTFPAFVDRSELVSAGMLALVQAAQRFDPDRGVPFAGYAAQRVRGAVLDVARSEDWSPRSVRQLARQVDTATQELAREHGSSPSDVQIAEHLGVPAPELRRMRERVQAGLVRALDSRGDLDRLEDEDQMIDRTALGAEELLEDEELRTYLRAGLELLSERHRLVVVGLYLEGRSFEDLAALLGVTPSRISQLRADALAILRHGIESQFSERPAERPKGRVAIRQARFSADLARAASHRSRQVPGRWPADDRMPVAEVPDSPAALTGAGEELAGTA
jgi:RNA polymerase sigma factor FliA